MTSAAPEGLQATAVFVAQGIARHSVPGYVLCEANLQANTESRHRAPKFAFAEGLDWLSNL